MCKHQESRGCFGSFEAPSVHDCGAKDAKTALSLFAELSPQLVLLKDSNWLRIVFFF